MIHPLNIPFCGHPIQKTGATSDFPESISLPSHKQRLGLSSSFSFYYKISYNPIALRKATIVCKFGLSECGRVNRNRHGVGIMVSFFSSETDIRFDKSA